MGVVGVAFLNKNSGKSEARRKCFTVSKERRKAGKQLTES
jgi:hypothetical protein